MSDTTYSSLLMDERVHCWSLMTTMVVGDYINLVENAYRARGGIKYQREALKTTSGRRIRERMIDDIKKGAILPPVVIGAVVNRDDMVNLKDWPAKKILDHVKDEWSGSISIIDGMQRTTALMAAAEDKNHVYNQTVRIECWISESTDSLIYRMLVLNTGQVPWNLKRQLQVVYAPLIEEMKRRITFERLLTMEKSERRYKGGEFSADSLVEAYLAFGLRKTEIDTQESLADEFSRLDMAEAITTSKYNDFFYPIVQVLVDIDKAFSRHDTVAEQMEGADINDGVTPSKFRFGRNIFDSQPARVGFIVACAVGVLGRLGMDRDPAASTAAMDRLKEGSSALVAHLETLSPAELGQFLSLDVLSEKIGVQKRSGVGRQERAFFETAFKALIDENFAIPRMEVCWRA
ncbi:MULTISPECIES: hypothetical protein [Brevundimonas]|jgi:hypothetical protein|uniref:Uncharacterized protein n=1 Tax=Brevundimonas mediterranea TaxID=74329 RepID=A0A7Z8Y648_9CAUL|nr:MULTISPECIES: hypothetical protein [Brevundimonas]MCG2662078.1 hypothetical protein [Brevundimonas sp.]VDC51594.1 hypothetical protein BREV_BREV_02864 [Brevundimonas mediterranea]